MVKISAQSELFSVLVLKVSHSKFWLFQPIFKHLDPESGSRIRIRIQAQIECGSNRIRIRIRNTAQKERSFTEKVTKNHKGGQQLDLLPSSRVLSANTTGKGVTPKRIQ